MTIKEEKALRNYIKGLVRESLGEIRDIDDDNYFGGGLPDHYFDEPDDEPLDYEDEEESAPAGLDELRKLCEGYAREAREDLFGYEEDPEDFDFDEDDEEIDDERLERENPYTQDYGIYELRKLCEGMARQAVSGILTEKKGGKGWKKKSKDKKRKNKKEKTSSKDKTIVSKLNADGTNAAHYFYKLYGVENGTEAQKASARSKGYKKAKGKKNDTGVPYKFTSKERNRLNSLLTDK